MTLSEKRLGITASLNSNKVVSDAEEVQNKVRRISAEMVSNIRKSAELSIAMFQAFGGILDESFALAIQAGLRVVELFSTIILSETAFSFGLNFATGRAFLQAAAIAAMLITIANIQAGRTEAAAKSRAGVRVLQLATWR